MSSEKLLGRYKTFPISLYRLQQKKDVKLRDFHSQQIIGRNSYDFILKKDGLIHPNDTEFFLYPNGMSLRPIGLALKNIVKSYKFNYVYEIPKDTPVPENLVLLHEHTDHYSLQTCSKCTPEELNEALTKFLYTQKLLNKTEFLKFLEI